MMNKTLNTQKHDNDSIINVNSRYLAKKVSGDGVFFRCSKCKYEPMMASKTDDLLNMNYCPKCGNKFE